jgi:indolepyruvate ferredoxin oxidoreductase alpha subunit
MEPARVLLSGDEAVARGAVESSLHVATGYPGTPSTEILEALARVEGVDVQWSTNEKVALDVALGAALGGANALCAMKHVGLNVAADTLMTAAYTGVGGALVIVSADDPGMHSSQNEQDNRFYAKFASIPLLEPSDSDEARRFTKLAFTLSRRYDVPVLLRLTTRIAHTKGVVLPEEPRPEPPRGFVPDPKKYVMLPSYARARHPALLERLDCIAASQDPAFVTEELRDREVGVVTSGVAYHYVREVLPGASVLKLNLTYPLPVGPIEAFASKVGRLFAVEELEPFLEDAIRGRGIRVEGKVYWGPLGELTPERVRDGFAAAGVLNPSGARAKRVAEREPREWGPAALIGVLPFSFRPESGPALARPPVLCPGCPHVAPMLALRKLGAIICGDIGCYTLAALPPLNAMDTCLAMGSSIGMATGISKTATGRPVAAAIGDSTFLHSGVPALIDAVYKKARITIVILDNGTTAMTGGQPHPGTGQHLQGDPAPRVDVAALCRAIGVEHVATVDPYDFAATFLAVEKALAHEGVAVVITNRPCVQAPVKIKDVPYGVLLEHCNACQACMNLGCPAVVWVEETYEGRPKVRIDDSQCTGCTLCAQICPTLAIQPLRQEALA